MYVFHTIKENGIQTILNVVFTKFKLKDTVIPWDADESPTDSSMKCVLFGKKIFRSLMIGLHEEEAHLIKVKVVTQKCVFISKCVFSEQFYVKTV